MTSKLEDLKLKIENKIETIAESLGISNLSDYEPFEFYYYLGFLAGLKTVMEMIERGLEC